MTATMPAPATFVASTKPTAADLNSLRDGINDLVAGGIGVIAHGLSTSTHDVVVADGTYTVGSAVTLTLTAGRIYEVMWVVSGQSVIVSNTAQIVLKCFISGAETGPQRIHTANGVEAMGTQIGGSQSMLVVPGSTGSFTYSLAALCVSGSGGGRIQAASGVLVKDLGT